MCMCVCVYVCMCVSAVCMSDYVVNQLYLGCMILCLVCDFYVCSHVHYVMCMMHAAQSLYALIFIM